MWCLIRVRCVTVSDSFSVLLCKAVLSSPSTKVVSDDDDDDDEVTQKDLDRLRKQDYKLAGKLNTLADVAEAKAQKKQEQIDALIEQMASFRC